MKLLVVCSIFLIFYGCNQHGKTIESESVQSFENAYSKYFKNKDLIEILNTYNVHLMAQKDTIIHNQPIRINFFIENNDTLFSISTGKYLPRFLDTTYKWVYFGKAVNNNLFIGDNTKNPLSNDFINIDSFAIIKDSKKYHPSNIYDEIMFEGRYWTYKVESGKYTLVKKEN